MTLPYFSYQVSKRGQGSKKSENTVRTLKQQERQAQTEKTFSEEEDIFVDHTLCWHESDTATPCQIMSFTCS